MYTKYALSYIHEPSRVIDFTYPLDAIVCDCFLSDKKYERFICGDLENGIQISASDEHALAKIDVETTERTSDEKDPT